MNEQSLNKRKLIEDICTLWNSGKRNNKQQKALLTSLYHAIFQKKKIYNHLKFFLCKEQVREGTLQLKLWIYFLSTSVKSSNQWNSYYEFKSSIEKKIITHLKSKYLCMSSLLDSRLKMKFQRTFMKDELRVESCRNVV